MATKFTFKKNKGTFPHYHDIHDIKLKKNIVGFIDQIELDKFKVRFMVVKDGDKFDDNNPNCSWMWVTLKKEFNDVNECRQWLNDNFKTIMGNFKLMELKLSE